MFKWQCQNEQLKDLLINNLQEFKKEKELYLKLVDNFKQKAGSVNNVLINTLKQLPEEGFLPACKVKKSQNDFSRNGYFNLYRWCVTEHNAFVKGNGAATELWKHLFGTLPQNLADYNKNNITVDENGWNNWYKEISYAATPQPKRV